jgi:hypothetical protein
MEPLRLITAVIGVILVAQMLQLAVPLHLWPAHFYLAHQPAPFTAYNSKKKKKTTPPKKSGHPALFFCEETEALQPMHCTAAEPKAPELFHHQTIKI